MLFVNALNVDRSTILSSGKECCWSLYPRKHAVFIESLTTQSGHLIPLEKKAFENIVGKGENAGNQHLLLFPQCFLLFPTRISMFESELFCCIQIL